MSRAHPINNLVSDDYIIRFDGATVYVNKVILVKHTFFKIIDGHGENGEKTVFYKDLNMELYHKISKKDLFIAMQIVKDGLDEKSVLKNEAALKNGSHWCIRSIFGMW
jgi:hypothetical protein